ncbi:MAG: 4Fe-4S binding protein [Candidatus Bathyarchaeia archaeon]
MIDPNLSINIAGINLKFPTILSSGPLTRDGGSIKKVKSFNGIGAIVIKTVKESDKDTPRPSMVMVKGNLLNYDWQALSVEKWIKKELKLAKETGIPIIANALASDIDTTINIAKSLELAGADMFELPAPRNIALDQLEAWIKELKKELSIPLIIKVKPDFQRIDEYAKVIERSGADAISGIDTLGPGLAIDIYTGKPLLGSKYGYGYLSGSAIKPIALRCISEISRAAKIPVIGGGGIIDWKDAIEMFMVGASAIHIHTAAILRGLKVFQEIVNGIKDFMKAQGYSELKDLIGLSLKYLQEEPKYELHKPMFNFNLCNSCGLCGRICIYEAISIKDRKPILDENKCFGCGLCASACPTRAIKLI